MNHSLQKNFIFFEIALIEDLEKPGGGSLLVYFSSIECIERLTAPVCNYHYYCLLPRKLLCFGTAARFFQGHLIRCFRYLYNDLKMKLVML